MRIETPDWVKNAIFYQIFPDRFARSEGASKHGLQFEAWDFAPTPYGFKGGDLAGIVEHLDYLLDLGVTALYLTPIFSSASNHRYHTYDYFSVDPLLGGDNALRELLDAAHARGMKVVLDGVFNHASRGFWQFHHVLENGAGSPYTDWFYFNPDRLTGEKPWGAYPHKEETAQLSRSVDSLDALGYRAWVNLPALPKFNTNNPMVREFIFSVAEYWLRFGIDGWRLDVASEIDDDNFWQEFRRRVKEVNPDAYIVAEIWHESQRWLQGDQFDAVMNYLIPPALLGLLLGKNSLSIRNEIQNYAPYLYPMQAEQFAARINAILALYDPDINHALMNLLDSHDTPRFITTVGGDASALMLAWFFIFTYPGAPCIYYGDEIGLDGGQDPGCRKSFPWEQPETWNMDTLHYLRRLIRLRKAHPALRTGEFRSVHTQDGVFAYLRSLKDEHLLIIMNADREERRVQIDLKAYGIEHDSGVRLFGAVEASKIDGILSAVVAARSGGVLQC